jgi:hypothetical protein
MHCLHDFDSAINASGPGECPDRERLARREVHGSREDYLLAHHEICTHTPT